MQPIVWIAIIAASAVVSLVVGFGLGYIRRKRKAESVIGSAEAQAKKILEDGIKAAETKKKEALIDAKEEILRTKNDFDNEVKERRNELTRQERRVSSKEEALDKKAESLEKKDETLNQKIREADELKLSVEKLKQDQVDSLQKIAQMTSEQAKEKLLQMMEDEIRHEKAMKLVAIEEEFKDEADEKAKEILSTAIQRCAADHVAEITVSVVPLPSEEM
ncbi:MAG: DUF3552 domain-containing protein, partial [Clostridia bacterium]|nr:DUF3552 domain-containing protein [Clostridia bacterium]